MKCAWREGIGRTLRAIGQLVNDDWQAFDNILFNLVFDRVLFIIFVRIINIDVKTVLRQEHAIRPSHQQVATQRQNVCLALHQRAL